MRSRRLAAPGREIPLPAGCQRVGRIAYPEALLKIGLIGKVFEWKHCKAARPADCGSLG